MEDVTGYTSYYTKSNSADPTFNEFDRIVSFSNKDGTYLHSEEPPTAVLVHQVNIKIPTLYSVDSFRYLEPHGDDWNMHFSENGTATVKMAYFMVSTLCWTHFPRADPGAKTYYVLDTVELTTLSTIGALAERISNSSERVEDYWSEVYPPVWMPSTEPESMSTLAHFLSRTLPHVNASDETSPFVNTSYTLSSILQDTHLRSLVQAFRLTSCKVSAFWDFGDIQLQ